MPMWWSQAQITGSAKDFFMLHQNGSAITCERTSIVSASRRDEGFWPGKVHVVSATPSVPTFDEAEAVSCMTCIGGFPGMTECASVVNVEFRGTVKRKKKRHGSFHCGRRQKSKNPVP